MSVEKNPTTGLTIDLFGPTIEFLTAPEDAQSDFCMLKGMIPPGGFVPLHSHPETEDFFILSGKVLVLRQDNDRGDEWIEATEGDYVHIPVNVPHAFRNIGDFPVIQLIATTKRLGQFLREAGRPMTDALHPVTPEDFACSAMVGARYGFWIATPEENATVGIHF
ncbi:cupin domain-containing protein [Ktedonospora formicarum]|uniref:Cupin n=1 Tax=Ktedonospora formicarum TaxID=2778364 RepID=A0A8J3MY18_9CHLR|nr:cupin domain-containing protein [Ktedonospora formicarum]GHO50561.1 cupin [Ktedonospora formicarum]